MAEVELFERFDDYNDREQDLQDHILGLQGFKGMDMELFRPSLAEQRKVGFYRLDRNTQTEVTEIVDLQEMTEVLQTLLQDVNALKREIYNAKNIIRADFETRLQEKALELYCRVNDRVSELEKQHHERVAVVRRAFKQQLVDALQCVQMIFDENARHKNSMADKKESNKIAKLEAKVRDLQAEIVRNDSVIDMLKMQLSQHANMSAEAIDRQIAFFIDSTGKNGKEVESLPSARSPSINPELDELRMQVKELREDIRKYETELDEKEDFVRKQEDELESLRANVEKKGNKIDKLKEEIQQMKVANSKGLDEARLAFEQEKLEIQRRMSDEAHKAREEVLAMARKETEALAGDTQRQMMKLMEENKKLEEQLAKEKAKKPKEEPPPKKPEPKVEDTDTEKLKANELKWRQMVAKMKKEVERTHRMWERKFAILQQSLHALKDESFIRQTLQKQSATLHHAAISYASDTPLGILPQRNSQPKSPKKPLPEIPRTPEKDLVSYTVSAPSGRGTALQSVDDMGDLGKMEEEENQVMSEGEMDQMPPGMVPLPTPPRNLTECGEDSRPSTRQHVVVLPSAQVQ